MAHRGFIVAIALSLLGGSLAAQEPMERREQLQREVMQRFMMNVRTHTGMSDEQFARFQEMTRESFEARAQLQQRERRLWMALEEQMRPGIAADRDSVTRLLDELVELQAARAQQLRREQVAYQEFLDPVQRAQVTMAWRRLQEQIVRIRRERRPPMRRH